jgi:hypothetical protein
MLALAMILTAAMMVPGDGPEKVSGEMVRESEPLDLKAKWVGTLENETTLWEIRVPGNQWVYRQLRPKGRFRGPAYMIPDTVDEGSGRLRLNWIDTPCLGIYQQHGDRLVISFRESRKGRATSFRPTDDQYLLILHRVESSK